MTANARLRPKGDLLPTQLIFAPHPRLAPWVQHVLVTVFESECVFQMPAVLSPTITVFARGTAWMSDRTGRYHRRMARAALSGPHLHSRAIHVGAGACSISLQFRPGAMTEILGPGVNEFREQSISLDCVFPPSRVALMLERMDETFEPAAWAKQVEQLLLEDFPDRTTDYKLKCNLQIISMLFQPAERFAAELGIGVRQLERITARGYGANLRDIRRMVRFGFSLTKMLYSAQQRGDLTQIAHDFGYYDQSHMDRDFVSLVGCSPTQLQRSLLNADPRYWMYRFEQKDFQRLFVPEDVSSVQKTAFTQK